MNTILLIVDHFQNLSVISSVNIPWPPGVDVAISYLRAFRLDFANKIGNFSFSVSYRAQYIVLVNMLPLVIAIILLAIFQPLYVILWYLLLLIGIGSALSGVILKLLKSSLWSSQSGYADVLMGAGFGLLGLLFIIYGIMRYRKYHMKKKFTTAGQIEPEEKFSLVDGSKKIKTSKVLDEDEDDGDEENGAAAYDSEAALNVDRLKKGRKYPLKKWYILVKDFILSVAFLYFGIMIGYLMNTPNWIVSNTTWAIPGYVMIAIGIWILLRFVLSLFKGGRKFMYKFGHAVSANVGTLILTLMGVLYLPIATSIFEVFACTSKTCDAGYELYKDFNVDPNLNFLGVINTINKVTNISSVCVACSFANICSISSQLCPSVSDYRLIIDNTLSCSNDIYPYYLPGAIPIMLIVITGVPILYFRLIKTATKLVGQAPVPEDANEDKELAWDYQMHSSNNICRGLYYGFKFKARHYLIVQTLGKMLVIAIFVFAIYFPSFTLVTIGCIYVITLLWGLIQRPYNHTLDNALNITCLALNVINSGLAIAVSYYISIPSIAFYVIGLLNVVLPFGLLIYLMYIAVKRQKKLKAKFKNRTEKDKTLIADIDDELNTYSVKRIVEFFLMLGIACFLSLSISLVGIVNSASNSNVLASDAPTIMLNTGSQTDIQNYVFAGYSDWTTFTTNCCCQSSTDTTKEVWKCLANTYSNNYGGSFLYKVRNRIDSNGNSGLGIRGYCSTTFTTNGGSSCGVPTYNSTLKEYQVTDCSVSPTSQSDYIRTYLW